MSQPAHPALAGTTRLAGQIADALQDSVFDRYMRIYEEIYGWFSVESAALWDSLLGLQTERGQAGHLLEIGVHHGKSAALIAMHADPRRESCVLVDRYLAEPHVRHALPLAGRTLDDSIQLMRVDSTRLAVEPLVVAGFAQFRWIHIDGEHTARAVMSDLALAHALLGEDGIVCVEDFFNWWYPQITEAVLRYCCDNSEHFQLFLCGYDKAYLARPRVKHDLLEHCADRVVEDMEERGVASMVTKTSWPAELNCFGIGGRHENRTHRGPDWDEDTIRF